MDAMDSSGLGGGIGGRGVPGYSEHVFGMATYPPSHQQQPATQPHPPSQSQPISQPNTPIATEAQQASNTTQQTPQLQPQATGTFSTLRLRDDPPPVTQQTPRTSRKRKSPASSNQDQQQQQQQQHHPPPPPPGMHPNPQGIPVHSMPPPHGMVHPAHMGPIPHAYQYVPSDYTAGGLPPPQQVPQPPPGPPIQQTEAQQQAQANAASAGRTLSQSKRAEQNRKAQRAFRERRDQHVKALESRSQLLDAALASADEANRRWEECRALVDQLRIENAALRAALSQAQEQLRNGSGGVSATDTNPNPNPTQGQSVGSDAQNGAGGVKESGPESSS